MTDTLTGHDVEEGELPEGWESSTFGDVSEFVRGVTYKKAVVRDAMEIGYMPLLRATNLQDDSIDYSECVYVPHSVVKPDQLLRSNDLVVATSSGSSSVVGKSGPVIGAFEGTFGAFCAVIRPHEGVRPRYLHLFAQSPDVRRTWSDLARGTNINNLKEQQMLSTPIPVAPPSEQDRIVEILEEQLSRLDTALESVRAVREKAAQFRRSLLHAAFTGALTGHDVEDGALPEGWAWSRVGEVTENHDGVRVPVKRADRAKMQGEYPYYGASGVIDHVDQYLFDGTYLLVSEDGANLTARTKPIAFEATGRFWVNNHAHVLAALSGVSQRYLMYLIDQSSLDGLVTGTAQPKITQRNLVKIPVPLPPLEEQERIVEILEDQLSRLDASLAVADAVAERSAALRRSLLHSAFTGRLTEEWREAVNV